MGKVITALLIGLTIFGVNANLHKADATESYRVDTAVVTQVSDQTGTDTKEVHFKTSDGNVWVVYGNAYHKGNKLQVQFDTKGTTDVTDDVVRNIIDMTK